MFVIRDEQIRALDEVRRQHFVEKAVAHLSRHFPSDCERVGEKALHELVKSGIDRANAYELMRELDVTGFISLMLVLGPEFEKERENLWMGEILESDMVDPDGKMRMIFEDPRWLGEDREEDEDEAEEEDEA